MSARVQTAPFDLAAELAGFGAGAGAIVTFTGVVRDDTGTMAALEIEHYPGMTERALSDYGSEAAIRFALSDWRIIHRHGRLAVGEPIMMVATAARHRQAAFQPAGGISMSYDDLKIIEAYRLAGSIVSGSPSGATIADAVIAAELVDAMLESVRERRWIAL